MAEPPASGAHSDVSGVNQDARVGAPTRDPDQGHAGDVADADAKSAGQPDGRSSGPDDTA